MSKNFTKVIRGLINQEIAQIHTSLPAQVVRVKGMDIDVKPLVKLFRNGAHQELPIIYSIPFMPPQTISAGIRWNPQVRDNVLLLVSEISIDNLMGSTGTSIVNSDDGRSFDLSDAIAINGFLRSSENKPLSADKVIEIHGDNQTITIKKNGDIELGKGLLQGFVTESFKTLFNSHTHNIDPTGTITFNPNTPMTDLNITNKVKGE